MKPITYHNSITTIGMKLRKLLRNDVNKKKQFLFQSHIKRISLKMYDVVYFSTTIFKKKLLFFFLKLDEWKFRMVRTFCKAAYSNIIFLVLQIKYFT